MIKWLHHLFNPHCPECKMEKECPSCEVLLQQLNAERRENNQLLQQILELTKPQEFTEVKQPELELDSIKPKVIPWRVRQQMLEAEARVTNKIQEDNDKKLSIQTLEKELGVSDATGT